jgi:GH24 family phage-related lysozyme (muramidase)
MSNYDTATNLVKQFEGCRLTAYQDQVGVWTCGYGSTGVDIGPNTVFTQQEAEDRLNTRITSLGSQIQAEVTQNLSDGQLAALISFAYNLGLGALKGSTLLKVINGTVAGDVKTEFLKWDHAGGAVVQGLLNRRTKEYQVYAGSSDQLPDGPSVADINNDLGSVE